MYLFHTLNLFLFFAASPTLLAQNFISENLVEVATYWENGEAMEYDKNHTMLTFINGLKISETICSSSLQIDVLNELEGNYQLVYSPKNSRCNESAHTLTKRLYQLCDSVSFHYQSENTGVFIGLSQNDTVFNALQNKLSAWNMFNDTAYHHQLFLKTDSLLKANKSQTLILKKSFLHDLYLLHLPFGASYEIGEHYFEPDTLYFPLIDSWLTQLLDFEMTHFDFEAMNCTLQINLKINKADLDPHFHSNPLAVSFDKTELKWEYVIGLLSGRVEHLIYQKIVYRDIIQEVENKTYTLISDKNKKK